MWLLIHAGIKENYISKMGPQSLARMIVTMQVKWVLVYHKEKFQLIVPFRNWETITSLNIFWNFQKYCIVMKNINVLFSSDAMLSTHHTIMVWGNGWVTDTLYGKWLIIHTHVSMTVLCVTCTLMSRVSVGEFYAGSKLWTDNLR